jgi:hypothetical protein
MHDHFAMDTPKSFAELIHSEEELLKRLLWVSQRQIEIVNMGNMSVLLQHLEQRDRLWDEFDLLEKQLAPHKAIPPEQRIWHCTEEREATESARVRCKELLEQIMANDQISLTKTEEDKNKLEKDIRRIQLAATVAPAYAKQSQLQR